MWLDKLFATEDQSAFKANQSYAGQWPPGVAKDSFFAKSQFHGRVVPRLDRRAKRSAHHYEGLQEHLESAHAY